MIAGSAGAAVLLANSDSTVRDPLGIVIWPVDASTLCVRACQAAQIELPLRALTRALTD